MIRGLIYLSAAVVCFGAAVVYPEFRWLYLLCALFALGSMSKVVRASRSADSASSP